VQREAADPAELCSPTRRAYLVLLVGLAGVIAVVALLTGVYLVLDDALQGRLGATTLRETRIAAGMLVTAGTISAFHVRVFRADRSRLPQRDRRTPTRWVLVVGAADEALGSAVASRTGTMVQVVHRTDGTDLPPWPLDQVVRAVESVDEGDVLVLQEADGTRAIPISRVRA
jgi:hypothetical protein